jgi:hypothetical protein
MGNGIKEISSESMRSNSREQLRQTRERYEECTAPDAPSKAWRRCW